MKNQDFAKVIEETVRLDGLTLEGGTPSPREKVGRDKESIDENLVVFTQNRSAYADFFHYAAAKVENFLASQKGEVQGGRVIMMTGASRGSGKTICALNLALAFAKVFGNEVIFLDGDCRSDQAQRYLGLSPNGLRGFSDVIAKGERADRVTLDTGLFNLVYFPSGEFSEDFIDKIRSDETSLLLQNLRKRYRFIILDTPPVFPMPETAILSRSADAVLLVLRAGKDGEAELEQCRESLEGARVMGVLFNDVKSNLESRSYYYGYYGKRRP